MPLTKIQSLGITDGTIVNADISASAAIATSKLSGGTNTPAFFAYQGTAQTYSTTLTKIQLNTESFDTNSNFDSSTNYRFTPTTAGKYFIYGQIFISSPGTTSYFDAFISKNNSSELWQGTKTTALNIDFATEVSAIISMNGSTDYIELYGRNGISKTTGAGSQFTYMTGFKIIE